MKQRFRQILILFCILAGMTAFCAVPAAAETRPQAAFPPEEVLPEEETEEYVDSFENDVQLAAYLEKQLFGAQAVRSQNYNGSRLSGFNREIYNAVKPHIEAIAAGTETQTSFNVTISLPDAFEDLGGLTAEDLGLESLTVTGTDGKPRVASAVSTRMRELTGYNSTKTFYALLRDCPAEMFWFGLSYTLSNPWMVPTSDMEHVYLRTSVPVKITVYGDFADPAGSTETASDGSIRYYTVDAEKTGRIGTAVASAQSITEGAEAAIIAEHPEKEGNVTDRDLLEYYFRTVRGLSAYNSEAASASGIYGDPWQIIWLFDGDPDTTVVCEGYAKGFQVLCGMTDFADDTIRCIGVTGYMGNSTVLHMWNLVRLEDGKNYLVDATNAYMTAGGASPDYLCLSPCLSGSVADGYKVQRNPSNTLTYHYDSATGLLYSEAALTLAGDPEEPEPEPVLPPEQVAGTAAVDTGEVVRVTWEAVEGAEGYHIYKKMGSGSFSAEPAAVITEPAATVWEDADITERVTFSYRVKAFVTDPRTGNVLESEFSDVVPVRVRPRPVALSLTDISVEDVTYTGRALTPAPLVRYRGLTLEAGTDYTVEGYADNISAGTASVTLRGLERTEDEATPFTGTVTVQFAVLPRPLEGAEVTPEETSVVFSGQAACPAVSAVTLNGETVPAAGYTVSYADNIHAGTGTLTVTGTGDYTGTAAAVFTIRPCPLDGASVTLAQTSAVFTGKAVCPAVKAVTLGGRTVPAADYTVSYSDNVHAGTGTVALTGRGDYTGTAEAVFTIRPVSLSGASVTLAQTSAVFTGKAIRPAVKTVTLSGKTLGAADYTVAYKDNIHTGTGTVTVTGTGDYTGTAKAAFTIAGAVQTLTVTAEPARLAAGMAGKVTAVCTTAGDTAASFTYTSSDASVLTVDSRGRVTAKTPGTAVVTVTSRAADHKAVSARCTIKVVPRATASVKLTETSKGIRVTWKKVSGADGYYIYRNGKKYATIKDADTLEWLNTSVKNGNCYTYYVVAYSSATGAGAASVQKKLLYVERPVVTAVKSTREGRLTVTWEKNSKADGYRIEVGTDGTFSEIVAVRTVSADAALKKTIGGLASGRYCVRIRAYILEDGIKRISTWSTTQPVRVK